MSPLFMLIPAAPDQTWRLVSVVESFGIICTLVLLMVLTKDSKGLDYTLSVTGLLLVFVVLTYSGQAAYARGLPTQDYNVWLAYALGICWLTLSRPWRWPAWYRRVHRRPFRA